MTARRILRDDERRAWLRLARTETIGPTTFAALIARFPDVREALDAAPRLARHGGAKELRMPSEADARGEIEALARLGGRLLASIEPDFPSPLAALDPPPPMIAVLGDPALFKREMVAVVGARNASALGIKFATRLAADLGAAGLVVASGLARGIDHAAHNGALNTGTVAVIAG
ncbi:MAG: processing protein, partial [Alphaproteobacteria bacterium]|nr:processing protein [Alphaproteobacteria bacterium]